MERSEGNQEQSINKYSEEEYTGSSKFEKIQEQCVQNKEKVDQYSKIISISLFLISIFIIYDYGFIFFNNELLLIAGIISYPPFIYFSYFSEERIYSKVPAILGTCLIVIATIIAIKESFFSNGLSAKNLIEHVFNSFNLYTITYSIHCIIVYILGHTIFKNNKIKYTARIIELEVSKGKYYTYFAHFYDYTNEKIFDEISEKEYYTWEEGDYIETILQPQIDGITVKKITHLENFEGKTDMEIFQEKHKRDVELFGHSQEEMDEAKGESKIESFTVIFLVIAIIDLLVCSFNKKFSFHDNIIYALTTALSLAITSYTSYKEYSIIKTEDNYTLEDLAIWKDYLVPRCLFYFLTTYFFVEGIINLIERIIF